MADGTFIDLRSHWLARIGDAAVYAARHRGGALAVTRDPAAARARPARGADPAALVRLAVGMRLVCRAEAGHPDHGTAVIARQENDPAPKFHFLEEGSVRVGLRVAFDLLDDDGHYLGDGHQDLWLYPEGDAHVTWAVSTVDLAGHGAVAEVWAEVAGDAGYRRVGVGDAALTQSGARVHRPFGATLANRRVVLTGPGRPPVGLYWARDAGEVLQVGYDHGALPPLYASRWPTGMQQWARGQMGWATPPSAGVRASLCGDGPTVEFLWREGGTTAEDVTHAATLDSPRWMR